MNAVTITTTSLKGIQKAVSRLARRIQAPESLLPTYGRSIDFAHPHIEVNQKGLHFVVVERGHEQDRKTTSDPNELAYWIFQFVTFSMASHFELHHRREEEDCRRILFSRQEQLLAQLDSSWCDRLRAYHARILAQHPFDDQSSVRAQYCKKLRDTGTTADKAWRLACDKYPLPRGDQN